MKRALAYAGVLHSALKPGSAAIIGTFVPDEPTKCSRLPVCQHYASSIADIIEPDFNLIDER